MRFYLSSFLTATILTSASFAEESIETAKTQSLPFEKTETTQTAEKQEVTLDESSLNEKYEDHAEVKTRALSEELQLYMDAKIIEEEENPNQKDDCDVQLQTGLFDNQYPQIFFPYWCHSISSVSAFGDSLALEDGSIWDVHPSERGVIMNWKESDVLLIYPNRAWFSTYKYKIENTALGTTVYANMTYGPFLNGEFSLRIIAIDPIRNEIYLNDNSRWKICSSDQYLLNQWVVGDYIIVGSNNSWLCSLKNILINSNMYNHIRAQQF